MPLTTGVQEISAFVTLSGLLSYKVMSFGLRNVPATFQQLMNRVIAGLEGCAVYLDDVVIYNDTWSEHLSWIRNLFDRFAVANFIVHLSKCEFVKATVSYLWKVVGQAHVHPV